MWLVNSRVDLECRGVARASREESLSSQAEEPGQERDKYTSTNYSSNNKASDVASRECSFGDLGEDLVLDHSVAESRHGTEVPKWDTECRVRICVV